MEASWNKIRQSRVLQMDKHLSDSRGLARETQWTLDYDDWSFIWWSLSQYNKGHWCWRMNDWRIVWESDGWYAQWRISGLRSDLHGSTTIFIHLCWWWTLSINFLDSSISMQISIYEMLEPQKRWSRDEASIRHSYRDQKWYWTTSDLCDLMVVDVD